MRISTPDLSRLTTGQKLVQAAIVELKRKPILGTFDARIMGVDNENDIMDLIHKTLKDK